MGFKAWRRRFTAAAACVCALTAACCGSMVRALAVDAAPPNGGYIIRVSGPSQVQTDDEIRITVTGCGNASGGSVVTAGLEIVSVSGGFSSLSKYVCMADLGGLVSTYACRVTAPAGATCTFGLSNPTVSDPRLLADVDAVCDAWTCAVRAHDPPAASAVPEDAPCPVPETLADALADTAAALPSICWDDISADYMDIPYEVITGSAYLAQMTSWRDYSDFMFDNDFVIVPFDSAGEPIELDDQQRSVQATGQHIFVADRQTGAPVALQDMVMQGDVTGQGTLGISQLVRMAQAVTGRSPLIGLHRQAGDLNGNGRVDLGDLTCLAAWLRGRFPELPAQRQAADEQC